MQLRNEIKRPNRFEEDPTIYQAPKRAPQTYRPKAARPHSCVDFNPNLAAAAFPTLDQVRPESPIAKDGLAKSLRGGFSTDLAPLYQVTPTSAQKASEPHCPAPARCQRYPDCTNNTPAGFDPNSRVNNGPPNPVFVRNWTLAGQLAQRTDDEWFEQEVLTSESEDDDRPIPDAHSNLQKAAPPRLAPATWENLTLAVQLLIYTFLSRRHPPATVRAKLGLSKICYTEIARSRNLQQQYENCEETGIKQVVDEQRELLLQSQSVHQSAFADIFNKHLVNPIRHATDSNFDVDSMDEIELGRQFLSTHGLDSKILGEWGVEPTRPSYRPQPQAYGGTETIFVNDDSTSPDQVTIMTFESPSSYAPSTSEKRTLPRHLTTGAPTPPLKRVKPNNIKFTTPCPAPTAITCTKVPNLRSTTPPARPVGPITHAEYMYMTDLKKLGLNAAMMGHLPSLTTPKRAVKGGDKVPPGSPGIGKGLGVNEGPSPWGVKQKLARLQILERERRGMRTAMGGRKGGVGAGN
ncbi:MAG: hypothetical protein M1836_005828 [Candelina mexicana]|nr:MAG: hypothetical protein M1836_005828 [Candelina mexicana]